MVVEQRREIERLVQRHAAELAELRSELAELRSELVGLQARVERLAPLVSIVIICWNNRRFLKRCFDSLMRTDYPNLEIFLADNASGDGSAAFVAENYPSVRVIVNPTNLGFAEGNNRALRLARGKYVITLNPDTEVDPNWVRAMVDVAESDGSVGMLSPKMYILDRGRLLNSAGGDMLLRSGDNLARGFYLEDDGRFDKVEGTFGPSASADGLAACMARCLDEPDLMNTLRSGANSDGVRSLSDQVDQLADVYRTAGGQA